VTKEVK